MKKSMILFTLLSLFCPDSIHASTIELRERKRYILIKLIESNSTSQVDQDNLKKNLKNFVKKYPFYAQYNMPFCQNMTLAEFLLFHKKGGYILDISNAILEKFLLNNIPARVTVSLLPVIPDTIPIKKQTLSSHGCQKTNLACAFTCKH